MSGFSRTPRLALPSRRCSSGSPSAPGRSSSSRRTSPAGSVTPTSVRSTSFSGCCVRKRGSPRACWKDSTSRVEEVRAQVARILGSGRRGDDGSDPVHAAREEGARARAARVARARQQLHRHGAHPARPRARERRGRNANPARLRRGCREDPQRDHPHAPGERAAAAGASGAGRRADLAAARAGGARRTRAPRGGRSSPRSTGSRWRRLRASGTRSASSVPPPPAWSARGAGTPSSRRKLRRSCRDAGVRLEVGHQGTRTYDPPMPEQPPPKRFPDRDEIAAVRRRPIRSRQAPRRRRHAGSPGGQWPAAGWGSSSSSTSSTARAGSR